MQTMWTSVFLLVGIRQVISESSHNQTSDSGSSGDAGILSMKGGLYQSQQGDICCHHVIYQFYISTQASKLIVLVCRSIPINIVNQ